MNNIQMAFCNKIAREYYSLRADICREFSAMYSLSGQGYSAAIEERTQLLSQQLVRYFQIRIALVNVAEQNILTTNQMNRLISVESLIEKVSQKWNTRYDNFEKEVADAAREVEAENEESRKVQNRQQGERRPLI